MDSVTDRPFAVDFGERNRAVYASFMKIFGYDVENQGGVTYTAASKAATPLFTVSTVGRVELLTVERAPFEAIPLPKLNEAQSKYVSNIDMETAVFTAVPACADGARSVAVMDLIYKYSHALTDVIIGNCELGAENTAVGKAATGTVKIIKDSMSASLLTILNYGDMPRLIDESVQNRISGKAFEIKGNERSKAASAALSIIMNTEKEQK